MRLVIETVTPADGLPDTRWFESPSWEALQALLSSMRQACYSEPRLTRLTRIARVDGGSDYRGFGVYELELADGTSLRLTMEG